MMRSRTRARHERNVVDGRFAEQPARPYPPFRRLGFPRLGEAKSHLLGVPVVCGLGIRCQNVDMVAPSRRSALVQVVLLDEPWHRLDLGVVVDDETERI